MKYHHLGIPTKNELKDEKYLEHLKLAVSGFGKNEYGIEWMRFDDDADYPEIVKKLPHVAFEVENLKEAIEGKNAQPSHRNGIFLRWLAADPT